jgi:hypothetical protein
VGGCVEGETRMRRGESCGDGFKSGTVEGDPQLSGEQVLLCLMREVL